MGKRIAAISIGAALVCAAPAAAQTSQPFAPWDGTNPFNCILYNAGTGPVPNVPDDPFCVEFDKNSQSVAPNFGILDFLLNEPGRVAAATPKCFYYQTDHWTGALVQGQPPELWHWDGQYFFDKALGVGGVNIQNFRVAGQPTDPSAYGGQVPTAFAPYMDQGGGGAFVTQGIPADPNCVARVDTQAERNQIYAGGIPPPTPPRKYDPTVPCLLQNGIIGSESDDELLGSTGGDLLIGLAGDDLLAGFESRDCLQGQRGDDRLRGGSAADQLKGGSGRDRVRGGRGRDRINGGDGGDFLRSRDGKRDRVKCGDGIDQAMVDPVDDVGGCEIFVRPETRKN